MKDPGFQFPCAYTIKAMGHNEQTFAAHIVRLLEPHTGPIEPANITCKPSRNQRYLSVNVTIQAHSHAQLDAIYQELTADPAVLMRL
jgi:putative lipoic acid-binding regulatory protein